MAKRTTESKSIKDLMGAFIKENNLSKGFKKLKLKKLGHKLWAPAYKLIQRL